MAADAIQDLLGRARASNPNAAPTCPRSAGPLQGAGTTGHGKGQERGGLINVTRAVLPYLREAGGGKIVDIGSRSGFEGEPG
ncbi:hypothetical protein [Amycolatopsis sp. RTGN1]|uniref:hypothetical protein n=1 Tax=Amycolatopsis ponsaeliensis TaxID=2992142 RepID=UPI00254B4181|nr:hypothetical protein [Amycolatopsis sp. RTGN1]